MARLEIEGSLFAEKDSNAKMVGHLHELHLNGTNVADGNLIVNKQTYTEDITLAANYNASLIGPVSMNSLTVNGNLRVTESLTVSTGNLTIAGDLRIV